MKARLILLVSICIIWCALAYDLQAQDINNISCINQYYHNWQDGVFDVCIGGDYAYLACGDDGLRIVNIANPAAMFDVSNLPYEMSSAVTVDGNYAYVGSYFEGVTVIDISNPYSPQEVITIPIPEMKNSISIYDNIAYVCHDHGGLTIVDVGNPLEAQIIWTATDIYECHNVEVRGNLAYVAASSSGMIIMDVSDPSAPTVQDIYRVDSYDWGATGVSLSGNYAYLSTAWHGLEIVDLTTLEMVASIDSLVYSFRIKTAGDYAYMTYGDPECPLAIIDISNPHSPQVASIYYPPEDLVNFFIVDDIIYLADRGHGLRLLDITNPAEPNEAYVYSRYGKDIDVIVKGNYAYVQESINLKIIDITDMQNPVEIGYYESKRGLADIKVVGEVAYLVENSYDCLTAVDISNPSAPSLIGAFRVDNYDVHYRVAVYNDYAYLVENQGLRIVDISDPANMIDMGLYAEEIGNAWAEPYGHFLFVQGTGLYGHLLVLDVADPLNPQEVSRQQIGCNVYSLRAVDDKLFMMADNQLLIYDINNLEQLARIDVVTGENYLTDLEISGDYVFLTADGGGLYIYNASDPQNPELVGHSAMPTKASGVYVVDDIALVADETNLGFYDCSEAMTGINDSESQMPEIFALLGNYPNPFNSSTNISFELLAAGHVNLGIFDLLGRRVATLANSELAAGRHIVNWDGTSYSGQTVASGRYYIKAQANGTTETRPILLLK